jgi:RNA polymerase sigma-70 factor (ECF subfamily)
VDTAGPSVPDPDDALRDAQRGDARAFSTLYRCTQPWLLRYLRVLAGDDAEDIASETWLQAARDLHSFSGGYDSFRGWIVTIGRHRALDQARRRDRRPQYVPVPPEDLAGLAGLATGDDTAAAAIEAVSTDAALRLIAALPPDQAEAVLLRAVAGLDAKTAGQVIGKRAGAVRSAAYRGLRTQAGRAAGVTRARDLTLKEMR